MTFVAQPYERFVDDLLTALTGGVTREEHLVRRRMMAQAREDKIDQVVQPNQGATIVADGSQGEWNTAREPARAASHRRPPRQQ